MNRYPGMGGGSMLRAVGRAVGAGVGGVQEAISSAATTAAAKPTRPARLVSVPVSSSSSSSSSPSSSSPSFAASTETAGWQHSYKDACLCEGDGWESVGEEELGEGGFGLSERFVFGPAPSKEEVVDAVSTIQQIFVPVTFSQGIKDGFLPSSDKDAIDKTTSSTDAMCRVSSAESESDWIEPALQLFGSKTVQSQGRDKVLDAFRLLQINPSVQRMVVSLSSDKAVWDAVMKNEAVQELREAFYADKSSDSQSPDEGSDVATRILRWIFHSTKAKIMEFVDKITKIVNELFHPTDKGKKMDVFEDALRSSFMLSIVVFIVVIINRVHSA